jgi:chemotaxis protein MotB
MLHSKSTSFSLRAPKREDDTTDDWLVTFADISTLLLIFFILMFAMAGLSSDQLGRISQALQEQGFSSSTAREDPFEELVLELEVSLGASGYDQFMYVETKPGKVEIEMASSSFFVGGTARFQRDAIAVLKHVAEQIKPLVADGKMQVKIEGHTDDVPIKTANYPSNWELSAARASNVVRFLIANGIAPQALQAIGYADTRPKLANLDATGRPIPENRALNRRVVITVSR